MEGVWSEREGGLGERLTDLAMRDKGKGQRGLSLLPYLLYNSRPSNLDQLKTPAVIHVCHRGHTTQML